jgi:hypothetical protein
MTHMLCVSLDYSANVDYFSHKIFQVISFDIFHIEVLNDHVFQDVTDNEPISDSFDIVGYE